MFAFTVLGFVIEGGRYLDICLDVLADTPADAMEQVKHQNARVVVSSVRRSRRDRLDDY
jgi:hypothetical protein